MADAQSNVFDFRKPGSEGFPGYALQKPVFLVGFMGAGKTSVGRKLARLSRMTSIDMDTFIVRRCDMSVASIFAEVGEEGFRAIETEVLRELASGDPHIVSCGGGVVLAPENREILDAYGFTVYLQVTAAEAAARITNVSSRPLFGNLAHAEEVIKGRIPLYEEVADLTVDTAGKGTGAVAREIFGMLKERGVIWQRR